MEFQLNEEQKMTVQMVREFAELVERGAQAGVDVGFAISPGLSISYASPRDRRALIDKFRAFRAIGTRFVSLALDDVPTRLRHPAIAQRVQI